MSHVKRGVKLISSLFLLVFSDNGDWLAITCFFSLLKV
jgi:hypothetical protein